MGFFRNKQIALTVTLLEWKLKRDGMKVPERKILHEEAERIVDEAREIAKKSGSNILSILKDVVNKKR